MPIRAVSLLKEEWPKVLLAATLALGVLSLLLHWDLKPQIGDEGVTAVDAWRLVGGQLPQRDYFEIIPPLSALLLSWAFEAFGLSVAVLRSLGVVYGLLLLGLTWLVARRLSPHLWAQCLPLAVLVPFGVNAWPFPSHHWLADLFCLAALLALSAAASGPRTFLAAAVGGGMVAAACFTLQDQGGLAVVASLLPLFWIEPVRRLRYLGGVCVGGLAVALLIGALWLPADLGQLWQDWVLFPMGHYRRIPGNAVGIREGVAQMLREWDPAALGVAPLHAGSLALGSTLLLLLPLACIPSAWTLWKDRALPRAQSALLLGFAVAFLGTALHRWSLMNLIWAAPLPAVLVAAALARGGDGDRPWYRQWGRLVLLGLLAVFLTAGALRTAFVLRTPGHEVTGRAGTYRFFNPHQAKALQEFLDAIESRVPAGEGAFVRGYLPLVSFLALRPNPTPFTFYQQYGYHTPAQADRWTASLDAGPVRWGFASDSPLNPTDPSDSYLGAHYRVVWRNGTYCLWERTP